MGTAIENIFALQMGATRARPLSTPAGRNSIEQIRNRMAQEAINSGSNIINLNHFLGALIGHPNGQLRIFISDAIREENTCEDMLRDKLGLNDYSSNISLDDEIPESDAVSNIFLLASLYAKQREENLRVQDLLTATVGHIYDITNAGTFDTRELAKMLIEKINELEGVFNE